MFNVITAVRDVRGHIETACGEMAHELATPAGMRGTEWADRIRAAKKRGVRDIPGWLADELYNDAAGLSDMMGDRIYDVTGGDRANMAAVFTELERIGHPAMVAAVKILRGE